MLLDHVCASSACHALNIDIRARDAEDPRPVAGYVPTKFAASLTESDEARAAIEEQTLVGRLGSAGDMAAAVAYLASDDAAYVSAETLVVAGGMHSRL